MGDKPTADPTIVIEDHWPGYVRYRRLTDGRRWEVFGTCAWTDSNRWGPCGEGVGAPPAPGPPEGRLDIPVTPELDCSLCVSEGHLTFRNLEPS